MAPQLPLVEFLDTPSVEAKDAVAAALAFKICLKLIPRSKNAAAVIAPDEGRRLRIDWNPQPYRTAKGALQKVVQIFAGHGLHFCSGPSPFGNGAQQGSFVRRPVIEYLEDFGSQAFPLFPVFLGQAPLIAQSVKHPLEHVQFSGSVDTTAARQ